MRTLAVIPARYDSSRFPGKPLAMIHDRPMIQWVYERAKASERIDEVLVATDDERIMVAVNAFGGQAVLTSTHHPSGTDRIAEAVEKWGSRAEIIMNVQGDEPAMDPAHLTKLVSLFTDSVDIATLVTPFRDRISFEDPNRVKAVLASNGRALYFSRSSVPFDRRAENDLSLCYQHLGVYAYRSEVLKEICGLPPSPLELKESLEQLRWLENGYSIQAAVVKEGAIGVDTPEDLERVKRILS